MQKTFAIDGEGEEVGERKSGDDDGGLGTAMISGEPIKAGDHLTPLESAASWAANADKCSQS